MKTIDELVNLFADAARNHGAALEQGDHKTANKAIKQIEKVMKEMGKHDHLEVTEKLGKLLNDNNDDIKAMTAAALLNRKTKESLTVLETLSKKEGMIGFRAQKAIENFNNGAWQFGL